MLVLCCFVVIEVLESSLSLFNEYSEFYLYRLIVFILLVFLLKFFVLDPYFSF